MQELGSFLFSLRNLARFGAMYSALGIVFFAINFIITGFIPGLYWLAGLFAVYALVDAVLIIQDFVKEIVKFKVNKHFESERAKLTDNPNPFQPNEKS